MKITCYITSTELLPKSFCQIAERCYYSNENSCAIIENENFLEGFDRGLWTYSKKHFIPHATKNDPLPEIQPVYITDKIENPNNSKIVLLVNPSNKMILDLLADKKHFPSKLLQKILFIFDDTKQKAHLELQEILQKSQYKDVEFSVFEQDDKKNWNRI